MPNRRATRFDPGKEADALLLERYISASVVINNTWEIVHFRGDTSPYLAHASGKASLHILHMAQPGLVRGLRTAIARAQKEGCPVKRAGLVWQHAGQRRSATIEVLPLPAPPSSAPFFLVLFTELPSLANRTAHSEHQAPQEKYADERDGHLDEPEGQEPWTEALLFPEQHQGQNKEPLVTAKHLRVTHKEERTWGNQELQTYNKQFKAVHDSTTALMETLWEPVLVLNDRLQVIQANQAFYLFFHTTAEATEEHAFAELGEGQWNIPSLLAKLDDLRPACRNLVHFEVDSTFPVIGHKRIVLTARHMLWEKHDIPVILLALADATSRKPEKQGQYFPDLAIHELKTPITSLKAYTELLKLTSKQAGDFQTVHVLTCMDDQIEILVALVQELFDAMHIATGHFSIHRTWVNLQEVVHECVEEMQQTTSTHHICIEREVSHQIYADRLRVRQILLNVLAHVLKYSLPMGRVLVTMDTALDGVILSVQDFGRGSALEHSQNVFEQFFRVSGDAIETYPGLGLGLYIAAQIVRLHGGRIWVDSEEGKGATFSFLLPTDAEESVSKDPEASLHHH